ncbi:MAG TPA: DUF3179 domain-containing (seleno)protein [Thermoanaerobaculia bacterium]|jgi:hypothetical protein
MSPRAASATALAALAALLTACKTAGYDTKPRIAVVGGDPIVAMASSQSMSALERPSLVTVKQQADPPFPDEKVLGVAVGTPRMYPIGLLDKYEVVNDESGEVPYVVARCALTDFTGALDRRVAGRTLTFENSGALWRDMLVLRDKETGTYWSPATGAALSGPLEGEHLRLLPGTVVTTADAWEELVPETLCMDTGELSSVSLQLKLYASSSMEGLSGRKTEDRRYGPKDRVFVVAEGGAAVAFSAAELKKRKSANVSLAEETLVLEWDAGARSPRAYRLTGIAREERPVIPLFWFAAVRHFPGVRTLAELTAPAPKS